MFRHHHYHHHTCRRKVAVARVYMYVTTHLWYQIDSLARLDKEQTDSGTLQKCAAAFCGGDVSSSSSSQSDVAAGSQWRGRAVEPSKSGRRAKNYLGNLAVSGFASCFWPQQSVAVGAFQVTLLGPVLGPGGVRPLPHFQKGGEREKGPARIQRVQSLMRTTCWSR